MDILEDNRNFTLGEEINGPLLAVAVSIELILTLSINLFVLIFTLCHPKTLKQPSIIFFTNFLLINLLIGILIMSSSVITAISGEWEFGETLEEKNATCQFCGFIFGCTLQLIVLTLTVISVDRFLYIVKPLIYNRFMKTWVAVVVVVSLWIFSFLMQATPYLGLGQYIFLASIGTCGFLWVDQRDYLVCLSVFTSTCIMIIVATTLWTFFFSRKFIQTIRQQHCTTELERDIHEHIYMQRIKKLFGIFGVLLTVTILTTVPATITAIVQGILGYELPISIYTVIFVLFLLNCVINPIVQSYFRRDVYEFIVYSYKTMLKQHTCNN